MRILQRKKKIEEFDFDFWLMTDEGGGYDKCCYLTLVKREGTVDVMIKRVFLGCCLDGRRRESK